jgi:dihydroflavonol-4-reductase
LETALVTGASGFLGWHVARYLLQKQGLAVRALVRPSSRLTDLEGVEPVLGDLRDPASLERAVRGCHLVFHVAADYRLWAKDENEMFASNVEGTRNVLNAAKTAGVRKIVYTSTVGCIGMPEGALGQEDTPVSIEQMQGPYKRSKFLAEQVALEQASQGVPVVIVNPTAPVGEHDVKPTPTGKIVVDFLNRKMPAYVDTGLNVVEAGETAEGHWLACERGRPGERYILGSENLTLQQIFEKLSRLSGVPAPTTKVPYAVAWMAGAVSTAWAELTGVEPRAPLDAVRMSRKKMWVTCDKAKRDLGFQPSPAEVALSKAVEWFRSHGYC